MALTKAHFRMIEGASVNVKDFGAVGDGVTDDYASFNAAITSGAGNVYVPNGTYAIGTNIVLPAGVSLVGSDGKMPTLLFSNGVTIGLMRRAQQDHSSIRNLILDLSNITNDCVGILFNGVWLNKISQVKLIGPGPTNPSSGQVSYGIAFRSLYSAAYTNHTATTALDALQNSTYSNTYGVYFNSVDLCNIEDFGYALLTAGAEDGGAHRLNQNYFYNNSIITNYYNIWMQGCGGGNTFVCTSAEAAAGDSVTIIDQSSGTNPVFISGEISATGDNVKGPFFGINMVGLTTPVANADGDSGTHLRVPESGAVTFYGNKPNYLSVIGPDFEETGVAIASSTTYDVTSLRSEAGTNAIYKATAIATGTGNSDIAYFHCIGSSSTISVTSDVKFGSDISWATDGSKLQITNSNASLSRNVNYSIVRIL